jgi:ATP-dependent exoDNAse (exonuclease V) alpha subunit
MTDEMLNLFNKLKAALANDDPKAPGCIVILQGRAGAGKSTFAKYIAAYCRSLGMICKGCASTGLAASVYDDFTTAHALFGIPVIEDSEEYDQETDVECKLNLPAYKERKDLLDHTKLIIWDEISSQHMKDVNAVFRAMDNFKRKVVLFIGDGLQITPVIPGGNKSQICAASIYCSPQMESAIKCNFSKNLRLQRGDFDPEQVRYIELLDAVSTNRIPNNNPNIACRHDPEDHSGLKYLAIKGLKRVTNEEAVLQFAFPNGFDTYSMHTSCILATTNERVDYWNEQVQQLNSEYEPSILKSNDKFHEVDDPFDFVKNMVTPDVLHRFNDSGSCPPHELKLKIGDICILMRAVNKEQKFATNTRVRIVHITMNTVKISALGINPKTCVLPRFMFKIKLPYGKSFEMTRMQFPLRLAYAMSINRSQGQTLQRAVADLTKSPFSHGHLNVALSRITDPVNIALMLADADYDEDNEMFTLPNIVYPEILNAIAL